MHENPAEVLAVLLHSMILSLDLLPVQEAQYVLLEGAGSLSGYYLDQRTFLGNGFVDDREQRPIDVAASVVDLVEVEGELHG